MGQSFATRVVRRFESGASFSFVCSLPRSSIRSLWNPYFSLKSCKTLSHSFLRYYSVKRWNFGVNDQLGIWYWYLRTSHKPQCDIIILVDGRFKGKSAYFKRTSGER